MACVFVYKACNHWRTILVQAVQFPLGLTKLWKEKKLRHFDAGQANIR